MKKLMYLIVLSLILGLVLTGCSLLSNISQVPATEQGGINYLTKGTETDPNEFLLYAGQDIPVGTVEVWNDTENLYVTYNTTGGWVLTETHLAVAGSLVGIPQTKTYNPIPGKFPYKHENLGGVTSDPYIIPLNGWGVGEELYIAAHAKVIRPIEDCWETVWQIGDVEEVNVGTGWLENYADEFNWAAPAGPITVGPTLAVNVPSFTNPFIVGTTPTYEFPYNSNYVRGYATNFDVQWNGSLPFGGLLTISWSPGSSASEKKVVSDDGIIPTTLNATGTEISGQNWFMDKYPLVEHSVVVSSLPDGVHTINFQHTKGDGTFWDWVLLEKPCVQEESAWAGTEVGEMQFPGKNWATYFIYNVQGILTGTWSLSVNGGTYMHDMFIVTQYSNGVLTGTGGYPESGPPYNVGFDWTLTGQLTGTSVTLDITYVNNYNAVLTGTVDPEWNSMGGTGTGGVVSWVATRLP